MLKLNASSTIKNVLEDIELYKKTIKSQIHSQMRQGMNETKVIVDKNYDSFIEEMKPFTSPEVYEKPYIVILQEKNRFFFTAISKDIAFIEYGTGIVGEASPHPDPKSGGVPVTGSWQYYYHSPWKTKVGDNDGWAHEDHFHTGTPAGKQLYEAHYMIKQKIGDKLKGGK